MLRVPQLRRGGLCFWLLGTTFKCLREWKRMGRKGPNWDPLCFVGGLL